MSLNNLELRAGILRVGSLVPKTLVRQMKKVPFCSFQICLLNAIANRLLCYGLYIITFGYFGYKI